MAEFPPGFAAERKNNLTRNNPSASQIIAMRTLHKRRPGVRLTQVDVAEPATGVEPEALALTARGSGSLSASPQHSGNQPSLPWSPIS